MATIQVVTGVHNTTHAHENLILSQKRAEQAGDGQSAMGQGSAAEATGFPRVAIGPLGGGVGGHDAGEVKFPGDGDDVGEVAVLRIRGDF